MGWGHRAHHQQRGGERVAAARISRALEAGIALLPVALSGPGKRGTGTKFSRSRTLRVNS